MIEAHDEVGGDDWFSGFAVEHKDGDGVCRLRAKRTAKRGCNDEGQEKANGKRASHERRNGNRWSFGRNILLLCHAGRGFRKCRVWGRVRLRDEVWRTNAASQLQRRGLASF